MASATFKAKSTNIEITGLDARRWRMDKATERICALNRFVRGSSRLTRDLQLMRSTLVATTLTHSAAIPFQFIGLLLTDHVDVLCEFLRNKVFASQDDSIIETSEEQNNPAPASALAMAESDERLLKRKRNSEVE